MKLFDFVRIFKPSQKQLELPLPTDNLVRDFVNISSASTPEVSVNLKPPLSKIKEITPTTMSYVQSFASNRSSFMPAEYDLAEIGIIADVDCFVSQAFQKKLGLMFKEGFNFIGSNKKITKYHQARMEQIAQASGIPTSELLRRIAYSLISTSNAFLIKVRDEEASGGKSREDAKGKTLKPVAAYFPAAPETMRVKINIDTGKILEWRQELPDGRTKDFNPDDVVHFTFNKKEGFLFGTPTLIPVIDDIRALRQIEENLELLIYQHLFPLLHYKVGTETAPAGYAEDGRKEIDVAKEAMRYMPSEGALITPERHEVKIIGAESKALRAEGYIEHFKRRVIAGLGISELDLGVGDTANRATSTTLSRALVDSVKNLQDSFEAQWNQKIIRELLLEGPFGDEALAEENSVKLLFNEIDVENKIEQQKHAIELFKNNGISHSEFRVLLSRDPMAIPEDPHDQDMSKYPDWSQTYWKLIEEPSFLIRAVDEPWSAAAIAAAEARGTALTQKTLATSTAEQEKQQQKQAEFDKQTKIAVAKAKPAPVARKDHFLSQSYLDLETDTVGRLREGRVDREYIASNIKLWGIEMAKKLTAECSVQLIRGFNEETGGNAHKSAADIQFGRKEIEDRINRFFTRLTDTIISHIKERDISGVHDVFEALSYRLDFVWDVEKRKARNYGRFLGARKEGSNILVNSTEDTSCEECQNRAQKSIEMRFASIDDLAPHHAHCICETDFIYQEQEEKDETVEDGTKLERCVLQVKSQLRSKHPGWDDKKVKSSAYAICNASLSKK